MKHKYYYKYLFIITIFFSGCSDWVCLPEINIKSAVEKDDTPPWVPYKINYLENISSFAIIDDKKMFCGTNDGKIYRSIDRGQNWDKVGEIKYSVPVTCFLRYPYIDGYAERILYFAGTERGVYKSEDGGSSWQESLSAEGVNGEWTKINYGIVIYSLYYNDYNLVVAGYDGEHNEFSYNSTTKKWNLYVSNFADSDFESVDADSWDNTFMDTRIFRNNKNNQSRIIFVKKYGGFDEIKSIDVIVNSIRLTKKNFNSGYLGTDNGFYITTDAGKTWTMRSMKDTIIYSLTVSIEDYIFAGTEKGLFFTKDEGKTWNKLFELHFDEGIKKIYSNKDYVYVITEKGEVYYFRILKNYIQIDMKPVLFEPYDGESVNSSLYLKWFFWKEKGMGENRYYIQLSYSPTFQKLLTDIEDYVGESYKLTNLESGKTYYWRVRCINLNGITNWSDVFSFTVK